MDPARWLLDGLGGEDVDEDDHEEQVDEVHSLHQTHRDEEVLASLGFDLRLTGNSGDGLRSSQAVTYRSTDGTAAQSHSTTDECAGNSNSTFHCVCCHLIPLLCREFDENAISAHL